MELVNVYLGLLLTMNLALLTYQEKFIELLHDKSEKSLGRGVDKLQGEGDELQGGITGYITGNHFFVVKEDLPPPEKELKYAFIVVKHGMVVPEVLRARTYPNDPIYKDKWKPGRETHRGRSLMLMVGRSLKSRYQKFFDQSANWNQIKVSTIPKESALKLTAQLGFGLFRRTVHERRIDKEMSKRVETVRGCCKTKRLATVPAECPWVKYLHHQFQQRIADGSVNINRCSQTLFETMRKTIAANDPNDGEWNIDTPEKLYNFWSLIVFEVLQGQKEPRWVHRKWSQIQSCVFDFRRRLLSYHPAIPAVTMGRLIHRMREEYRSWRYKFHVHVTDDIGALSVNWTLPNSQQNFWPDYGDAIMFDFFKDNTVQVFSFSGWQRTFDRIYEGSTSEFFKTYEDRRIPINDEDWANLCAYDGEGPPPPRIPPELLVDPTKSKRKEAAGNDVKEDRDDNRGATSRYLPPGARALKAAPGRGSIEPGSTSAPHYSRPHYTKKRQDYETGFLGFKTVKV